ncbi:MAG: 1-acyl-sn-glycerol-3-phosphate acyltransferase [Chloroflexi bacterium]|uniref:1-acyl-sn-glycerol-3-phosphate acyltransferase n=1 Tax=Candidatus Chlorohelix allophototropha TaxID=3003348 RepID=A0A8T7M113_9CHLR|nr:1-acyl-sn-glycerol-3-phosphate acyltransferase [Chloroflexota bacterium]WJW67519.1 lysophospholipid acyltransferase family protein [Chloroflexota bacterium L227-S17]
MIPARKNFLGELLVFGIARRSVWRAFHSVHMRVAEPLPLPPSKLDAPIIFYVNHSSWWDGYLAHLISRQVYNLSPYLMMDEQQLSRYPFFAWAGCFGVNRNDAREALKSLEYIVKELKQKSPCILWMFPQGEIMPLELRPLGFHSGLGWLVRELGDCYIAPVSFRFDFLREQYPDIFINIGKFTRFRAGEKINTRKLTAQLEETLTLDLDCLRDDVSNGRLADFETIVQGKSSTDIVFSFIVEKLLRIKPKEA